MRTRFVLIGCVLTMVACLFAPSASGIEQGTIGEVGPHKPHLVFEGRPLAGVYPGPGGADPYAFFRPPACRAATYCDALQFEVKYPRDYLREVFFGANIQLTWDNPYHSEKNPSGDDLDMFVWGDDGAASGGPSGDCGSPSDPPPGSEGARCDSIHPEVLTLTEPPNTVDPTITESGEEEDPDPVAIFITIVNHRGVNTGYKLTIDWFTFKLPPPPRFSPPARETSRNRPGDLQVTGPFDFEVTDAQEGDATPRATPRKILVPGPDGELHEVELPMYAAGQRLANTNERNKTLPWITGGIAGFIALVALVFLLRRRNRQLTDDY